MRFEAMGGKSASNIGLRVLLHVLGWIIILIGPIVLDYDYVREERDLVAMLPHFAGYWLIQILLFYLNTEFLIPKFLTGRKLSTYIPALVIAVAACFGLTILLDFIRFSSFLPNDAWIWYEPVYDHGFPLLFILGLSMAYKFTLLWFENERLKKQAEIDLLKSQVNPHFLFNTLNSIYSLAHTKSDKTEDAILKLSQLMRYMIYESDSEKVQLDKELEYLHNYIELQRIRISQKVQIQFDVDGDTSAHRIEPMLLIPFVENAFKYGVSYAEGSYIKIQLSVDEQQLSFEVENTINPNRKDKAANDKNSGFGIKNAKDRLQMLYPQKHQLKIKDDTKIYNVQLALDFQASIKNC